MGLTVKLRNKIEEFIADRRESDGGWASITPGDIELLEEIIDGLIELKCERDPDGDVPIETIVINRRLYEPMHFFPLPYANKGGPAEQMWALLEKLDLAAANMRMAAEQVDITTRLIREMRREREEPPKKVQTSARRKK